MSETVILRQKDSDTRMTVPDPAAERMKNHGTVIKSVMGTPVIKLNQPADSEGNR